MVRLGIKEGPKDPIKKKEEEKKENSKKREVKAEEKKKEPAKKEAVPIKFPKAAFKAVPGKPDGDFLYVQASRSNQRSACASQTAHPTITTLTVRVLEASGAKERCTASTTPR